MGVNLRRWRRALGMCILFLLSFAFKGLSQTNILVTYYDGTEHVYSITTSGKLFFDAGNLQIVQTEAATPTSLPVAIIRKITFTTVAQTPLPVKLTAFSIRNDKASVNLYWTTENEVNASHFDIERSNDGSTFENIGQVTALNSSGTNGYSFIDQLPKDGISYYRLKQVDADGKYTYSTLLMINRIPANSVTLVPNPASDYVKVKTSATGRMMIKIYSIGGQLVLSGNYANGDQIVVDKLTRGMYWVVINDESYKLIKN